MKKNANISRKKSSMRRAKIRFIAVSLSAVAALSLSGIFTRINAESVSERMIPCVRTIEPLREEETLHQRCRCRKLLRRRKKPRSHTTR